MKYFKPILGALIFKDLLEVTYLLVNSIPDASLTTVMYFSELPHPPKTRTVTHATHDRCTVECMTLREKVLQHENFFFGKSGLILVYVTRRSPHTDVRRLHSIAYLMIRDSSESFLLSVVMRKIDIAID